MANKSLIPNISRIRVSKARTLPRYGSGGLHDEQQYCFECGYKEGVAATRKAIREEFIKRGLIDNKEAETRKETLRVIRKDW